MFKPLCTAKVWLPRYVPSEMISLNKNDIEKITNKNAKVKAICTDENPCIVRTPVKVSVSREIQVNIGHGEGDTR